MHMLELRGGGGFLYQHRPDLMPYDFLTQEETSIWAAYYEAEAARRKHR